MSKEPVPDPAKLTKSPRLQQREARLKAALKANMAKRKAQVRARDGAATDGTATNENDKE